MLKEMFARVAPQVAGQALSYAVERVLSNAFSSPLIGTPASLDSDHHERLLGILEKSLAPAAMVGTAMMIDKAIPPALPAPASTPHAQHALPAPECPACKMNSMAMAMAGYAKGVSEACGVDGGPVPKGYGGTYPLAREAAQQVLEHASEMAARQPEMAGVIGRFTEAVTVMAKRMERVPDCTEAARLAAAADQARAVAHRLTFLYRQNEAGAGERTGAEQTTIG